MRLTLPRTALVLALACLATGGCRYCAAPYDYCGPLFGGAHDPYCGDCGEFHRVGTAFSPSHTYEVSPYETLGEPVNPGDSYYNPNQLPPITPTPTPTDGQSLQAALGDSADAESSETEGPVLFGPNPGSDQEMVRSDLRQ
ncbi:MAG: hypothetical protein MPJ50_13615 [Pirellulales bacterium]|nr:hypothetical protein [Pirellulales bacterium]